METFTWLANKVYESEIKFHTLITEFEDGSEQRRSKGLPRRRFVLKFKKQETSADEIKAFFEARKGKFEAFFWTPPRESNPLMVRFDVDVLSIKSDYDVIYEFGLPLIEVI